MVHSDTRSCPLGWTMHWPRFRHLLTIVQSQTLTTSQCVTFTIYSTTQQIRRSKKTTSDRGCNTYQNVGSGVRQKRADLELRKSTFSDFSSTHIDLACSQIAYPWVMAGWHQHQFRMCKSSSVAQTSTSDSFRNTQRWWRSCQTC